MKSLILSFLLLLCRANQEDEFDFDREMELFARLAGEENVKHLLSIKETKKTEMGPRKLEETKPEEKSEEKSQADDSNEYIYINNKPRELTNMSCNRDYLLLFSLFGKKIKRAYVTQIEDHEFCFGDFSCCTNEHFSHLMESFAMNINRLRKRYKPFIELLSFFRGHALRQYIKAHSQNPKCKYILYDNRPGRLNLFDDKVFKDYQQLVIVFISQIKDFVDKKEEFFGGFLCSICSPKQQAYIKYDPKIESLNMKISADVCNSVYMNVSFEFKVQFIYKYVVRRIADFIECVSDLQMQGFTTARLIVYPKEQYNLNKECYNSFSTERPDCLQFCWDNIDIFKYDQYTFLTRHIRQTLRLFYNVLATPEETIEEHYQNVYGYDFHMGLENQPLVIHSENSPTALKYNIKEYDIHFTEKGGINPFMTPISIGFWNEMEYIIEHSGKA